MCVGGERGHVDTDRLLHTRQTRGMTNSTNSGVIVLFVGKVDKDLGCNLTWVTELQFSCTSIECSCSFCVAFFIKQPFDLHLLSRVNGAL